jgi:ABC-type transport system involved in cytochrome bd biosynthesis fused ATPase/permease subunit
VKMDLLLMAVAAVVALVMCFPLLYLAGWAFSKGYHRGKREFVKQIVNGYSTLQNDPRVK